MLGCVTVPVSCEGRMLDAFPFSVVDIGSNLMGVDLFDELGFTIKLLLLCSQIRPV